MPAGVIMPFAGVSTSIPAGWLLCDGSYVSRTTYATLFAVLGTRWGSTDNTNFRLPLLTDKGLVGATNDSVVGQLAGSNTVTLATTNLPSHTHNVVDPGHVHGLVDPGHAHPLADPGHVHVVNDPGHSHSGASPKVDLLGSVPGAFRSWGDSGNTIGLGSSISVYPSTANVYLDRALTGVIVAGAYTNASIAASGTGVTLQNTGDGTPVSVLNAHAKTNFIIKT
jgi:microcystin-dependent protein